METLGGHNFLKPNTFAFLTIFKSHVEVIWKFLGACFKVRCTIFFLEKYSEINLLSFAICTNFHNTTKTQYFDLKTSTQPSNSSITAAILCRLRSFVEVVMMSLLPNTAMWGHYGGSDYFCGVVYKVLRPNK